MLNVMRKYAYSWGIKALLGFIAIVMTFWGVSTAFFSQIHPIASVNGVRILADQVDRKSSNMRRTLQSMYGENAAAVLQKINLRQEALQAVIEDQLIAEEGRHLGLHISEEALADKIASTRAFQENGQFDFRTYQEVLRVNGLDPTEYEAATREGMIQETLQQMIDTGVQVSPEEVRHAYDLHNEKIALSYLEVPPQEFAAKVAPTDQQLQDYYKRYSESFREPERTKIVYIHYQPLAMSSSIAPSDKDIEEYYKRNLRSHFSHPEQVHARHILIAVPEGASEREKADAKAKAEDVLKQVRAPGADFNKLAAKYSNDPSTRMHGGDLGSFPRGQMIKPFEDAVFKMTPGEVVLVETHFGFHVVQVEEVKPTHVDTLAEARPKIIESIRAEAGTKLAREALNQDLTAALGGASLDDLAKKRALEAVETPYFSKEETVKGAEGDRGLAEAAFKIAKGQVRAVPEQGAPYLVKVVDRTASEVPPFKQIEPRVREVFIRMTAESDARAQAEKLLEQIKNPADFDKVAASSKLDIHKADTFTRATQMVPGIGEFPEVADAAAAVATIPGVIDRVMEHSGTSYIFEVTARALPSEEEWKSDEKSFTDEYLSQHRAQAWTGFLNDLKAGAQIVIHTDQLGTDSSNSSDSSM
jgi:peptidyl-prolyl cis-trans isomerase D